MRTAVAIAMVIAILALIGPADHSNGSHIRIRRTGR